MIVAPSVHESVPVAAEDRVFGTLVAGLLQGARASIAESLSAGKPEEDSEVAVPKGGGGLAVVARQAAAAGLRRARRYRRSEEAWIQAAITCLGAGETRLAEAAFRKALDRQPNSMRARIGLAELGTDLRAEAPEDPHARSESLIASRARIALEALHDKGPEAALEILTAVPEADRGSPDWHKVAGLVYLRRRDPHRAVREFRAALRLEAQSAELVNLIGVAEIARRRVSSAEVRFREAIRLAPFEVEPRLNLFKVLLATDRVEAAFDLVESTWEPSSAPAALAIAVGDAYLGAAEYRRAIRWYEGVRLEEATREMFAAARNNAGVARSRLGHLDQALNDFQAAASLGGRSLVVVNVARAMLQMRRFQEVLELPAPPVGDVERPDFMVAKATAMWEMRDPVGALGTLENEVLGNVEVPEMALGMASAILVDYVPDVQRAVKLAREGVRRYPDSIRMRNNLAYSLAMSGSVAEASEVVKDALGKRPDAEGDVFLTATRGLIAIRGGKIEEGRALYEAALARASTDGLRARLKAKRDLEVGAALLGIGRAPEAVRVLTRSAAEGAGGAPFSTQASVLLDQVSGRSTPPVGPQT